MSIVIADPESGTVGRESETDYWHVDLWGWALPGKAYRSRSLYGRNLPDNDIRGDERNFEDGTVFAGLEVQDIIEEPWWHQIAVSQEVVERAWKYPRLLVSQGFIAPPASGP